MHPTGVRWRRSPVTPLPIASHPTPPLRRLQNLWHQHRPRLKRAPFPKPWPDFTEAEVVLAQTSCVYTNNRGEEWPWPAGPAVIAYFPDLPGAYAVYQGWFRNEEQYATFAALVFAHRNRDHPYSEAVRTNNPHLTDQQIVGMQMGWSGINWYDGPVGSESARVPPPAPPYAWLGDVGAYLLGILIIGGYFCLIGLLSRYSPVTAGVLFLATPFVCAILGKTKPQQEPQQNAPREAGRTERPG